MTANALRPEGLGGLEPDPIAVGLKANSRLSAGLLTFVQGFLDGACQCAEVERLSLFVGSGGVFRVGWGEEEVPDLGSCKPSVRVCAGAGRGRLAVSLYDRTLFGRRAQREGLDVLLCPGNVAVRVDGAKTIYWPQTVLPLARRAGEIGWSEGEASLEARVFDRFLLTRIAASCRRSDGLVFSSDYARRLYQEVIGVSKPTAVIYPPGRQLGDGLEQTQSPEESGDFLFVSTLSPYKMVAEMVQGFAEFVSARPGKGHRLLIVGRAGNAAYAEKVDTLIENLGLEDSVRRLGFVSNERLEALYLSAKYFVFPSACENAGSFALLEALAYGKTILCSNLSSMREICGEAALYFDPRKPAEVAAGMREVVERPETARSLAERALERSASLEGWERVVDETVGFARQLVRGVS